MGKASASKVVSADEGPALIATCTTEHWSTASKACVANAANHAQVLECAEHAGSDAQQVIRKFRTFRDAMCACKDKRCATGVSDEMIAWGHEREWDHPSSPDFTAAQNQQLVELGAAMGTCMSAAMPASLPSDSAP